MRFAILAAAALVWSIGPAGAQDTASPPQEVQAVAPQPPAPGGADFMTGKCKGPTNVASDSFEGDVRTKVGIYIGNVIITQADCKLRADKVVAAAVASKDINRLTATGNVVFNSSSGTATGDNGIYDLVPRTITMTGKVVLTKGKDVMKGTQLVVNLNTGLAHLTAKGMPGNRVQAVLVPAHDDSENQKPAKPKGNGSN
jgi:lipopolysaccharide export system protein LptA